MTTHKEIILNSTGISIESDAILSISIIVIIILMGLLVLLVCFIIYGEKVRVFFSKIRLPKFKKKQETRAMMDFITSLTGALLRLSKDKIGALIVIENHDNLGPYINIGNKIDSYFNLELVVSVFYNKLSPLHDGAMIIRNWKIVSLSSYLPMTKKLVNVEYGARHRAAMGICEQFDCFSFVVSETSGTITSFRGNAMKKLSNISELLYKQINEILENHFDFNKKHPIAKDNDVPKKLILTSNEKTK